MLTEYEGSGERRRETRSDFFLNCTAGRAYYAEEGGNCTTYAAKPGQCPIAFPGVHVPPNGATYVGNETINGVLTDAWQFYFPLYQSVVVAWVARKGSALVRFTGARVTTDWSNISYTVREDAFGIPKGCL